MNIVQRLCVQHFVTLLRRSTKARDRVQPLVSSYLHIWSCSALDILLMDSTNNGGGVGAEE